MYDCCLKWGREWPSRPLVGRVVYTMDAWWSPTLVFAHLKGGSPGPACLYLGLYVKLKA